MKGTFSPHMLEEIEKSLLKINKLFYFKIEEVLHLYVVVNLTVGLLTVKAIDVSLTYHKQQQLLKCHYCGYSENLIKKCKSCASIEVQMKGYGTEKLEEELQPFFLMLLSSV